MLMARTSEGSHRRAMLFDQVALAVMQRAWPHYTIGFEPDDGVWVAQYSADVRAPLVAAASPEALTALLGDDARSRRSGGDSGENERILAGLTRCDSSVAAGEQGLMPGK